MGGISVYEMGELRLSNIAQGLHAQSIAKPGTEQRPLQSQTSTLTTAFLLSYKGKCWLARPAS